VTGSFGYVAHTFYVGFFGQPNNLHKVNTVEPAK